MNAMPKPAPGRRNPDSSMKSFTLKTRNEKPEWSEIIRDLAALQEVEMEQDDERYRLRLPFIRGLRQSALGGAIFPPVRMI